MKNNEKNIMTAEEKAARKAATEKRLATMRANLSRMETRADELLAMGPEMSGDDRLELLTLVNVAYHESGKIETIYSIDGSAACEFCARMRGAAECNPLMICGGCYAWADAWKEAAFRRHQLNARILSTVLFTAEELRTLSIPEGANVRINEDGDTVNETHGRNILRIASVNPSARFGYWFKNSPAVGSALNAEGYTTRESLPENITFVQSSPLIGFPARPVWFADFTFTVYPDAATTAAAIAAGAWECNGRKCKACGFYCYMARRGHSEPVVNIAEVLRCNEKHRQTVIMPAYNARKAEEAARAI